MADISQQASTKISDRSLDTQGKENQWLVEWRGGDSRTQQLRFELDQGYHYSIVVRSEADKNLFLDLLLRPPETAIVSPDGGLLNNIRIDENLLLPLNYYGRKAEALEERILELFAACGSDQVSTHELLTRLPGEVSSYQRRLVAFVRSVLMNPRVMVYDSVWGGVTKGEIELIKNFDGIFRRYSPVHTAVYLDYDTHFNSHINANQTFIL